MKMAGYLFSVWFALCGGISIWAAPAGALDPEFNVGDGPNAAVNALVALPDGKLLVGGDFTSWNGMPATNLVRLNTDGSLDQTFRHEAKPHLNYLGLWRQLDGKILVESRPRQLFSILKRRTFGRLFESGEVDPEFIFETDGEVNDVAFLPDGRLMVAGTFSMIHGMSRPGIARLHPNGAVDVTFEPKAGISGRGESVALLANGDVLVAGLRWSSAGRSISLPRFRPDGSVDEIYDLGSLLFSPRKLHPFPDGSVLVANNRAIRLNADGSIDSEFNASEVQFSESLAIGPGGQVLLMRYRTIGPEVTPAKLVRTLSDGTMDSDFEVTTGSNPPEIAAVAPDGRIFIAGRFTEVNGQPRKAIASILHHDASHASRLYLEGARRAVPEGSKVQLRILRDGDLAKMSSVQVSTVSETAVAGTDFKPLDATVQFAPGQQIAVIEVELLNRPGALPNRKFAVKLSSPKGAQLANPAVAEITVFARVDENVFVREEHDVSELAGSVGVQLERLGTLNYPAGFAWKIHSTQFNPNEHFGATSGRTYLEPLRTNVTVSLRVFDNAVVDGDKEFTLEVSPLGPDAAATSSARVRIIDNDRPGFSGRGVDSRISSMVLLQDGKLLLAGSFRTVNGIVHPTLARIDAYGEVDQSFEPPSQSGGSIREISRALELPDGKLLVSGRFTQIGGLPRRYLARLNRDGTVDATFDPGDALRSPPDVLAITPDNQLLLAATGDSFNGTQNGIRLGAIMRLAANGQKDSAFTTFTSIDFGEPIGITVLSDGRFVLSGRLKVYGGPLSSSFSAPKPAVVREHIARFLPDGTLDASFEAKVTSIPLGGVTAVQLLSDSSLLVAGRFTAVNGVETPGLAKLTMDGSVDESFSRNINRELTEGQRVYSLAVLPDGKFLAALSKSQFSTLSQVWRFNQDGTADGTFSRISLTLGLPFEMVPLSTGEIVIGGGFRVVGGERRYNLAWLSADGALITDSPAAFRSISIRSSDEVALFLDVRASGSVSIESTKDFRTWAEKSRQDVSPGIQTIHVPAGASEQSEFLRAVWRRTE